MNYPILSKQKSVSMPAVFLKRFSEIAAAFSDLSEEMEDIFLSYDKKTVKKLRQARQEHLKGKIKPLSILS